MDTNINRMEDIKYLKQYLLDIKRNCNGKDDYLLFQNCLSEYACLMQSDTKTTRDIIEIKAKMKLLLKQHEMLFNTMEDFFTVYSRIYLAQSKSSSNESSQSTNVAQSKRGNLPKASNKHVANYDHEPKKAIEKTDGRKDSQKHGLFGHLKPQPVAGKLKREPPKAKRELLTTNYEPPKTKTDPPKAKTEPPKTKREPREGNAKEKESLVNITQEKKQEPLNRNAHERQSALKNNDDRRNSQRQGNRPPREMNSREIRMQQAMIAERTKLFDENRKKFQLDSERSDLEKKAQMEAMFKKTT